jgi:hypothetical protein
MAFGAHPSVAKARHSIVRGLVRTMNSSHNTRWFAFSVTGVLLLVWGVGLANAITGGLSPGLVIHAAHRPYPTHAVILTCCIITFEFVSLFAILRPFSLSGPRRVLVALGIFAPLWVADNVFFSGWTDQPGYCYANGYFLFFVDAFLCILAVILFRKRSQDNQ